MKTSLKTCTLTLYRESVGSGEICVYFFKVLKNSDFDIFFSAIGRSHP